MPTITETTDAAASISTTYTMEIGDTFNGSINSIGEEDWVAITLNAGESYQIDLAGRGGAGSLSDPMLRVRNSSGILVTSDDDGGPGQDSRLTFTATTSGVYYIEADGYSVWTGNYSIDVVEVAPPTATDALVWEDGAFSGGSGQSIEVFFASSGISVSDGEQVSGSSTVVSEGFTAAEISMIMEIFDDISDFADITFSRTFNQSSADMQFATSDLGSSLLGFMYPQNTSTSDGVGVFTSNSTDWNPATIQAGGGMYGTVVHEIGHGLGLAHPHDTSGNSGILDGATGSFDVGENGLNQPVFTVMSYNNGWNGHPMGTPELTDGAGHAAGFGALDISVLQDYYGVNTSHAAGDNVYTLGNNSFYNTIWDTGGTDLIRVDGSENSVIDLRAATLLMAEGGGGYVSFTQDIMGGFTIADGVLIENATGGNGNDTITGNSGNNTLRGQSGNDTISGGAGDDRVYTGSGTDIVHLGDGDDYVKVGGGLEAFHGGAGNDYISYYDSSNGVNINLKTNVVSGSWAGNDTISGFESASGSKTGHDKIYGTSGANKIKTYGGNDKVYAGKGTDEVHLGDGDDYVKVGGGLEVFHGGDGYDYISYYDSSNGVKVDLRSNAVSGSWAVNDTISGFEGASGSKTGHDKIYGTDGSNKIKTYGGNDKLYGRGGDDKLYGGDGEDRFDGGAGTDLLYGGADADVFHFDHGEDHDIIKDFENDVDTIQLDNFTFSGNQDAFDFASQIGADVVFDFGGGDMLTVENATILELHNDLEIV
ncbi:MAG: pre-peptidase C-terminal domain-containing protein [Halocynthiibacter sp.]